MRQIAYVSPSGRTSTLVYVDQAAADAQEERFRAQFGPDMDVEVWEPRSPNGQYTALAVGRKPPPGIGDIDLPPPDLVIVDNEGRVVGGMPGAYLRNWTPDGQGFFFVTGTENGPLQLAYLDGRPGRVFTDTYDVGEVAMSPDGRTIVYTEREYDREGLWRVYVEGGKPVRVFAGEDLGEPTWSPDGMWVAVTQSRAMERLPALVWLVDFTSGEVFSLEIPGEPVWSPDGRLLALGKRPLSSSKGYSVSLVDPRTRQVREIRFYPPDGAGYYSDLTWSPDSSQIAFILYNDIWIVNLDGSGLHRLTEDGLPKSNLRWIP